MEQIKYKSGEFVSFIATRSFALGAFNITVVLGSEVEFDGSTVQYAGSSYSLPQLRAAVKAGWVVLAAAYDSEDPSYGNRVSAGIKMRSATDNGTPAKATVAVTLETDERIVMSSKDHAASTKEQNLQGGRRSAIASADEGIEVRSGFKTAAGKRAMETSTVLTSESAGSALRDAENVQIRAGKGMSEAEMLERMPEAEREVYLAEKASIKQRYVDSPVESSPVVGTVKTAKVKEAEGMKLTQSVGGGVEIADFAGTGTGKAKSSTVTEDGITFKNTNGPEQIKPQAHPRSAEAQQPVMVRDGTLDARLKIAKAFCPEFPANYDFSAPDRKKLARLQADFEDNIPVIRAVFAAESDSFKAKLVAEFPSVFG